MRRIVLAALTMFAILALAACSSMPARTTSEQAPAAAPAGPAVTLGALTISDPWVRPVNPMAPAATPMAAPTGEAMQMDMGAAVNTGGYLTIANSAAEADFLVGASASPELFGTVELHTMIEEGGVMKMRPVEKIEVPANGEVMLKPGSFHVMFIDVKQELKPGDVVKLNLTFEKAGAVEVEAVVRPPTPMP